MSVRPAALLLFLFACRTEATPDPLATGRWIDLTHDFSSETIYWPTARPFTLEVVSDSETAGGYYYAAKRIGVSPYRQSAARESYAAY